MKGLNKEILRLALPSILANVTIPLVGIVDTAVAGHLPSSNGLQAATFIGAISVGGMFFNLLYWNFSFLRTGSGGLTAQAFGRKDLHECASIFVRGIILSLMAAAFVLSIQWPFAKLALLAVSAGDEVESFAAQYFFARIWAAPATISLMAFSGWFVGMQDSVSSMWKDLVVNIVNIGASIILALGIGDFKGIGFIGIAWGTVIAQYSGLLFCIIVCATKYRKVFSLFRWNEISGLFRGSEMKDFFKMNVNLLVRSLCFTAIYIGYTMIAAEYGDLMLAVSSIMMQLMMVFSYFTDGFAYAGEALTGKYIGAGDKEMTRRTILYIFVWSMSIAVAFIGIYKVIGVPLLGAMTSDSDVITACREFLPWLIFMPPLGCAAFTWDGIYLGATATGPIRRAMTGSTVCFLATWLICRKIWEPSGALAIHLLMVAYFSHLVFRTAYLSVKYRKSIMGKFNI